MKIKILLVILLFNLFLFPLINAQTTAYSDKIITINPIETTETTGNCKVGCTCEGETITCSTTETEPTITSIETSTGTSVIEIKKNEDKLEIKSGTTSVTSKEEFVIKESKLYMKISSGDKQIKIIPDEAISSSKIERIGGVTLETSEEKVVYSVSGNSSGKLFLVIPITAEIDVKINAETGEIISTENPWWSFLASGI